MSERFAICVYNEGYEVDLQRWKVYPVLDDDAAESHQQFRVVDESGEDYLYPQDWFRIVDLPGPGVSDLGAGKNNPLEGLALGQAGSERLCSGRSTDS